MPADRTELTKEILMKAMRCETAKELIALAKGEGVALTAEEAKAYLAELEDVELDGTVLKKGCGRRLPRRQRLRLHLSW